jgi:hypothetical protein
LFGWFGQHINYIQRCCIGGIHFQHFPHIFHRFCLVFFYVVIVTRQIKLSSYHLTLVFI